MFSSLHTWFTKGFPQNFIIRRPGIGTLILVVINFTFILVYRPFNFHASRSFSLVTTMALYCLAIAVPVLILSATFKKTRYFSNPNDWNILKEIIASVSVLCMTGLAVYFAGFFIEPRGDRWNWPTFFSSFVYAMLLGIVPVGFFFFMNFRYLVEAEVEKKFRKRRLDEGDEAEFTIQISSTLKKETLIINPNHVLYIESDGNYVVFYILEDGKVSKKTVRNSISNIEEQLKSFPFLFRTHRAYIVNLNHLVSQKGNTLGYRLKLYGIDHVIPVSRQNAREFEDQVRQMK